MSDFQEAPFKLDQGVDLYNPDVTSSELAFVRLKNIQPKFGRWMTPEGLALKETLQEVSSTRYFNLAYASILVGYGNVPSTKMHVYGIPAVGSTAILLRTIANTEFGTAINITAEIDANPTIIGIVTVLEYNSSGVQYFVWDSASGTAGLEPGYTGDVVQDVFTGPYDFGPHNESDCGGVRFTVGASTSFTYSQAWNPS